MTERWLNTGICNTTWNEWQIICACIDNSTMESLKKCVPSFLQWILSICSQKRQKKKEKRKASMRWNPLKDTTWIINESQMLGLSYRKKGKEGGPPYSNYLPLPIVTHFMFLLPEACFGFRKIQGWMFPLPNTPHSSYLPSPILSHITFVMFAVQEACFSRFLQL
jgi:hypothetical protein